MPKFEVHSIWEESNAEHTCGSQFRVPDPLLASCSDDRTAILWNFSGNEAVFHCRLQAHSDWVRCLSWGQNDQVLATGAGDNSVILWDLGSPKPLPTSTLTGHKAGVRAVAFRPGGEMLASASFDSVIFLWQVLAATHSM